MHTTTEINPIKQIFIRDIQDCLIGIHLQALNSMTGLAEEFVFLNSVAQTILTQVLIGNTSAHSAYHNLVTTYGHLDDKIKTDELKKLMLLFRQNLNNTEEHYCYVSNEQGLTLCKYLPNLSNKKMEFFLPSLRATPLIHQYTGPVNY